ncbi:DUF3618 domain-containing protein [Streptomyces sp. NPDC016562]|uniref:DUF3618 domain-containing protein n=1 Tax=Streptomyces sp. NPDC016562 TaxID=3364966 RepID=UPI0036F99A81
MGTTPDELRTDVEHRRAHLAHNVDLLADKLTPRRVAQRKAASVRHGLTGVKERVMGTAHDTAHSVAGGTGRVADSVTETAKEAVGTVGETLQQAPAQVTRQTQGSPLAAGIMAFGAGMLAAALLPTTEAEERAGQQLRQHSDQLLEPVKQVAAEAAHEVKEEMRQPATDAVEAVKSSAQSAVETTTDEAQSAGRETAEGLREVGRDAAQEVRGPGRPGSSNQPG